MPARNVPGLGLMAYWALGESGWKAGMDENIFQLSVMAQGRVKEIVTELPSSPDDGDRYILIDASDAFHEHICIYDIDTWVMIPPQEFFLMFDMSNGYLMVYRPAFGGWIAMTSPEAIKAVYEENPDTNTLTDALLDKLNGIETGATADMSNAEIKAAYEANGNTNAFTDALLTKLNGLSSSRFLGVYSSLTALQTAHPAPPAGSFAYVDAGSGSDIMSYIWDATSVKYVPQASGNSQETPETIKEKYESNDDTNAFTDADKAKLDGLSGDYLEEGAQIPWTDITDKPTFFSGAWSDLSGVPSSFPPSTHTHAYGDLTGLPSLFDGAWGSLSGVPSTFPPSTHTHSYNDLDDLPDLEISVDWADIENKPSTFTPSAHTHAYADLTGLPSLFSGSWGDLSGVPSTFPPSTHTHAYGDLTGLPTLFSGAYGDLSGIPSTFPPSTHGHSDATTSAAGFMSASDKTKLDGLSGVMTINTYTADHVLILSDGGAYVRMDLTVDGDVEVPPNGTVAFPIGTVIQIRASGSGLVSVLAGSGVTVNTSETLVLRKQGSTGSLIKIDTDEWDLTGDLEILP